jgi:Domain of unknown function (DUF397)
MADRELRRNVSSDDEGVTRFRKSSFSRAVDRDRVEPEVGFVVAEVLLRDSKDPDGPVLHFTPEEWKGFMDAVRNGEFDLE